MSMRAVCAVLLFLPALPAQSPAPLVAPARAATVSAGTVLQPAADGRGLDGAGPGYAVRFDAGGCRFEPALGRAVAHTQHLALTLTDVRRGGAPVLTGPFATAPRVDGARAGEPRAIYDHAPGVQERFDVGAHGVALSWRFDAAPAGAGDLEVRYALATSLPAPSARPDGGFTFVLPGVGGVAIGGATGVDARGARTAGGVRCEDGVLTLSLPAAFLANAAWPVVLDPLIGPVLDVSAWGQNGEPDVCYSALNATWLVVWEEAFAASDVRIRGQRLLGTGATLGGLILFGTTGVADRPRVASLRMLNRFAVVWTQQSGATSAVRLQTVSAATGAITHTQALAASTTTTFRDADVGGECTTSPGTFDDLMIVYRDDNLGAIRLRRMFFDSTDTLHGATLLSLWTDDASLMYSYSQPAIARAAGANGLLAVVVRRAFGINQVESLQACVVAVDGSAIGPYAQVVPAVNGIDRVDPDVDGIGDRWVVAWRDTGSSPGYRAASLRYGPGATLAALPGPWPALALGTRAPAVGYGPGKAWIGYHRPGLGGDVQLELLCTDGASATGCGREALATVASSLVPFLASSRVVAATGASSGSPHNENCLAVWSEPVPGFGGFAVGYRVRAQRLQNHGNGGSITNLGGGCGNGGTPSFSHNPAIGSNDFDCTIGGLPAGSLLTIFNFSPPAAPVPCGGCAWLPFVVTLTPPISGGSATVQLVIPCLSSLVGADFQTQWTTIDLPQAPCAQLPGFVMSDRVRLTIGQ